MSAEHNLNALASLLFDGEHAARDFKLMPGADIDISVEEVAKELLESMHRVGVAIDGKLVNPN